MSTLSINQVLWCKNGETVIIKGIHDGQIFVEYKGKVYQRPLTVIGKKLFTKKQEEKINHFNTLDQKEIKCMNLITQPNQLHKSECSSCVFQRCGDCFGKEQICDDYRGTSEIDVSHGTSYGDATFIRMFKRSRNH